MSIWCASTSSPSACSLSISYSRQCPTTNGRKATQAPCSQKTSSRNSSNSGMRKQTTINKICIKTREIFGQFNIFHYLCNHNLKLQIKKCESKIKPLRREAKLTRRECKINFGFGLKPCLIVNSNSQNSILLGANIQIKFE